MNIWVNGCFDILHTGHLDLLWYARLHGTEGLSFPDAMETNTLHVGVDTDDRVKMLKGNERPFNNVSDRVKMLSNLTMIDSVVMFHNDEELRYFIKEFEIDYMVIGDDYKNKNIIGAECTKSGVIYHPKNEKSTTNVVEAIKKVERQEIFIEMWKKYKDGTDTISIAFNNFAVGKLNN